jgi:hypothetical protein
MVWKSAPGGGGVLTAEQRTALWNDGAGLPYSEFTASVVQAAYVDAALVPHIAWIPRHIARSYIENTDFFLLWNEPGLDVDPDYIPTEVEYDVLKDWLDDHNMTPGDVQQAIGNTVDCRTWREIAAELFSWLIANPQ